MTRVAWILLFFPMYAFGQPNCNVYKMKGDSMCYHGCLAANVDFPQGSRQSQLQFDKAIELCPTLDYAYAEKAVPYLKRGDFVTWRKLIDKAVELNPLGHLGYRGWCGFQFARDYKGAIEDIERLSSLTRFDIGYGANSDYQLNVARALCYKALGRKQQAIQIIEKQLSQKDYSPMTYDYLHLGVLKLETGDDAGAIVYLKKSIAYNDYLAENYYYLALVYKRQRKMTDFKEQMEKAKTYYLKGYKRFDPYTSPIDKIYLSDIERELSTPQ